MKFDFTAVDDHTGTFTGVVSSMETNAGMIQKAKDNLLAQFQGAGATALADKMNELQPKIDAYQNDLTTLKAKISSVAGSGGDVHQADVRGGNRFRGL